MLDVAAAGNGYIAVVEVVAVLQSVVRLSPPLSPPDSRGYLPTFHLQAPRSLWRASSDAIKGWIQGLE